MTTATPQPQCRPCSEPHQPVSAVTVAVVVLLAVVVIYYLSRWLGRRQKDNFVTPQAQEVYDSSRELFDRTHGGATYSQYKTTVMGQPDPVTYTDIRNLWRKGELTPEKVQTVI